MLSSYAIVSSADPLSSSLSIEADVQSGPVVYSGFNLSYLTCNFFLCDDSNLQKRVGDLGCARGNESKENIQVITNSTLLRAERMLTGLSINALGAIPRTNRYPWFSLLCC